jgi:hypothetical protein
LVAVNSPVAETPAIEEVLRPTPIHTATSSNPVNFLIMVSSRKKGTRKKGTDLFNQESAKFDRRPRPAAADEGSGRILQEKAIARLPLPADR